MEIQNLSQNELKRVSEVLLKTRIKTKSKRLFQNKTMYGCLILGIILILVGPTLTPYIKLSGQLITTIGIMLVLMFFFIFISLRGFKKNIKEMINKRIGKEIKYEITKNYISYNGSNIPLSKINKACLYAGLIFLVFDNNFIVMKESEKLKEELNRHKIELLVYLKPFSLF